jgi:hypothetical protein
VAHIYIFVTGGIIQKITGIPSYHYITVFKPEPVIVAGRKAYPVILQDFCEFRA